MSSGTPEIRNINYQIQELRLQQQQDENVSEHEPNTIASPPPTTPPEEEDDDFLGHDWSIYDYDYGFFETYIFMD